MKPQKPIKERANKIFATFKSLLSPQALNSLSKDATFTGRFSGVDVIKHNENVVGIHTIDNNNIEYSLNIEGIEAFSTFQSDAFVKKKLELFTKGALHRLGRDVKDFIIDDHVRHEIIKLDLNTIIDPKLMKTLKNVFSKKGYDPPQLISVKLLAKKKGEAKTNIQFFYPLPKYQEQMRGVIEANNDLIKEIIGLLK